MPLGALTLRFAGRELRNRFSGSFSGGLWALFQPLLQLGVYAFVFVHIFKSRVPGVDYVPYLAVALWPWTAFAEAILRSTTVIQDNAALIGKVALPRITLVVANTLASFAIHLTGFAAILVVLRLTGSQIHFSGLLPAVLLYLPLYALALGLALICASLQVFVRDLIQVLGQVLPLLMFAAPIFYDTSQWSDSARRLIALNPFTVYAESFRALLLGYGDLHVSSLGIACILAVVILLAGYGLFRRLDPHFEDFL